MSLIAAGDHFLVLDQVNQRVTRWDRRGKASVLLPLEGDQAADLAAGRDGSVAVLDRLVGKKISLFGPDGRPAGSLPLDPEVVGDPGSVTGIFIDGETVYAERAHGPLVAVGTTRGEPSSDRSEVPGRPSRDGKLLLSAGIIDRKQGRVYVSAVDRATMEARFTRQLTHAGFIASIVALDSDLSGTLYLAVALDQGSVTPTLVTCLDATGAPLGAVEIPTNDSPEETLRELSVADDGTILFAHRLDDGLAFESYRCP